MYVQNILDSCSSLVEQPVESKSCGQKQCNGLVLQDLRFSFSSLWINQLLNASAGLYGYRANFELRQNI